MTVVVVGAPLDLSWAHRQQWLRSIKSLDLALFVNADDQGLFRRIEVEADDVAHLLDKLRISREFERLRAVRLQGEGPPDPMHSRRRHNGSFRRTPLHGSRCVLCASFFGVRVLYDDILWSEGEI